MDDLEFDKFHISRFDEPSDCVKLFKPGRQQCEKCKIYARDQYDHDILQRVSSPLLEQQQ